MKGMPFISMPVINKRMPDDTETIHAPNETIAKIFHLVNNSSKYSLDDYLSFYVQKRVISTQLDNCLQLVLPLLNIYKKYIESKGIVFEVVLPETLKKNILFIETYKGDEVKKITFLIRPTGTYEALYENICILIKFLRNAITLNSGGLFNKHIVTYIFKHDTAYPNKYDMNTILANFILDTSFNLMLTDRYFKICSLSCVSKDSTLPYVVTLQRVIGTGELYKSLKN